jgi:AAA family ATP:ADP antiporter
MGTSDPGAALAPRASASQPWFRQITRAELRAALPAASLLFLIFAGYGVLRPMRDDVAVVLGREQVRWLWTGTAVATFALTPPFGWLASRLPRARFVPLVYLAIALVTLAFFALARARDGHLGPWLGGAFYVWVAVHQLFALSLFWSVMADVFREHQAKCIFGAIAAAGTLGAIVGPLLTDLLVEPLGPTLLLLVPAGMYLALAAGAWALLRGVQPGAGAAGQAIGGSAWDGLVACVRSPYLLGLVAYVALHTVPQTLAYLEQTDLLGRHFGDDRAGSQQFLARLDFRTQLLTLVLQLVVSGFVLTRLGVGVALVAYPAVYAVGFLVLANAPDQHVLGLFAFFEVLRRGTAYGTRPARDVIFTALDRSDRYKAKAVVETFVYRTADVVVAQAAGLWHKPLVAVVGTSLRAVACVAVPIAVVAAGVGVCLGRGHRARAARLAAHEGRAV